MTISVTSGTRFFIGPVLNINTLNGLSDVDAATFFEAIAGGDWDEVMTAENLGDIGDTAEITNFTPIRASRVMKFKTVRDAGMMVVVTARDATDAGQTAMIAAEKATGTIHYAFKIVYSDHADADETDSIEYFGGMVTSRQTNVGAATDVTKRTFNIAVNSKIIEIPSEALVVPANLVRPTIIGNSVQVGVTLTAIEGEYDPVATSYAYQWQHDASGNGTYVNVAVGGTSRTYVPVVGDIADSLRVGITPTNAAGAGTQVFSLGTSPIVAA